MSFGGYCVIENRPVNKNSLLVAYYERNFNNSGTDETKFVNSQCIRETSDFGAVKVIRCLGGKLAFNAEATDWFSDCALYAIV